MESTEEIQNLIPVRKRMRCQRRQGRGSEEKEKPGLRDVSESKEESKKGEVVSSIE